MIRSNEKAPAGGTAFCYYLAAFKYLLLTTASLIITLAVYDILVKRVSSMRFLFGMRLRVKDMAASTAPGRAEVAVKP